MRYACNHFFLPGMHFARLKQPDIHAYIDICIYVCAYACTYIYIYTNAHIFISHAIHGASIVSINADAADARQ